MDAYLLDWANLLLRWAHVIVGIAWIGSSFYFVFLDNSLTPPQDPELKRKGVDGELWAVHGGGFYHPQKYKLAPKSQPEHLHWFYWESYSTWLTGFALFTVLYLFNAGTFLIDKSVHDWSPAAAIAASLGFLVAFWLFYDLICRWVGERRGHAGAAGVHRADPCRRLGSHRAGGRRRRAHHRRLRAGRSVDQFLDHHRAGTPVPPGAGDDRPARRHRRDVRALGGQQGT